MSKSVSAPLRGIDMLEGAGARIRRAFPTSSLAPQDPFVLLDEFMVEPGTGFPEHPHRGFEIITYMLEGSFRHKDNLGNDREIGAGGLQKITAGRGIRHSEMPGAHGLNHGLQLWINLPRRLKQIDPDYQEVTADQIPTIQEAGRRVRIIAGPDTAVRLRTPIIYLDVELEPRAAWSYHLPDDYRGVIYLLAGEGRFDTVAAGTDTGQVMLLGAGEQVSAQAGAEAPVRFALIAGRPHGEIPHLRGPFVD